MDGVFGNTYFYYKDRADSYVEYHDPRDADEVIDHYPPMKPETEAEPDGE
jgi:hypothetical protein